MVAKVTTLATKTVVKNPPAESPVGLNGSCCDYGGIGLQINPFAGADRIRKSPVWSGSHHFAIQMEVPVGATAEQLKPNAIQLANLIIPKLR